MNSNDASKSSQSNIETATGRVLLFDFSKAATHDDGTTAEQRAAHYRALIARYTTPRKVFCFGCGEPDDLGDMYTCRTCGDSYCVSCAAKFAKVNHIFYGTGRICPSCKQKYLLGVMTF